MSKREFTTMFMVCQLLAKHGFTADDIQWNWCRYMKHPSEYRWMQDRINQLLEQS